jgi:secernin
MGCDVMVALGSATTAAQAVFGTNSHGPVGVGHILSLEHGRTFAPGETAGPRDVPIPHVRQTYTVLGNRPLHTWGYQHGINEHQLAAACADWQSKLAHPQPGLHGTDLVRLVLERCKTARQAFELLTTLIVRHGQGGAAGYNTTANTDHVFLLADPREAYLVEAAGASWAALECREVRAASDVALIRQDWHRLSPGLGEQVIGQGWWDDDGSKLDFSASLSIDQAGSDSALRRWGRATLLLEQQHGNLDAAVLRHILADHYDGTSVEIDPVAPTGPIPLCRHASDRNRTATVASMIAELTSNEQRPAMAWCAYGPPCAGVYLPIFLAADLSSSMPDMNRLWARMHTLHRAVGTDATQWANLRSSFTLLQARIDQETEDFCTEISAGPRQAESLRRQATLFMQNHAEQLEFELQRIGGALAPEVLSFRT